NEVNRTEGLEASLAEAGNSLRVSEQCTREAVEQLDHERVQFQLALQEQQKSRLDLERTTEDRVRAMITERESKGAEEVLLERTRVEAERGQLTLERAANEEVLARISEGLANQDANMRLLEDAEEQLRSDRENHEAMLAQAYAQLGRQQTNLEIEKRNATLKSQAERIRPSPILTPYDSVDRTIPLEHFLTRFDELLEEYDITETQLVRIFDDRLTSSGVRSVQDWWARRCRDSEQSSWPAAREAFRKEFIQKTMSRKMSEITENARRKRTETVRDYAWRIADAARDAGLQSDRAVVMLINGCDHSQVSNCLRGAATRC
ncbi:hypothetical protein DYB28_016121, partial [Aphanomyces astaci]